MIIGKRDTGLIRTEYDGDEARFLHAQDLDPTLKEIAARRLNQNDNGFSENRSMRYIGTIPAIEIERNPELKAAILSGDNTAIENAMRIFFSSQEGSRYCVNKIDTGRSGKVRVR